MLRKARSATGVAGQSCVEQLTGAAGDPGRGDGFHTKEVGVGGSQADKVSRKQERQHLAPPVRAGPADPQHAGHDIEDLVGPPAGADHDLAGGPGRAAARHRRYPGRCPGADQEWAARGWACRKHGGVVPGWQAAAARPGLSGARLPGPVLDGTRSRAVSSRPRHAPVAQLDRVLPSEGRGQRFESSRARHYFKVLTGHMVYVSYRTHG
jgi:hypothetical protein